MHSQPLHFQIELPNKGLPTQEKLQKMEIIFQLTISLRKQYISPKTTWIDATIPLFKKFVTNSNYYTTPASLPPNTWMEEIAKKVKEAKHETRKITTTYSLKQIENK